MSRIGNKLVVIPAGIEVTQNGNDITVKGPKGELTRTFSSDITMNIEGNEVTFTRPNDSKDMKTIHGTTRANFNNMIVGVSEGFQKTLELIEYGHFDLVIGGIHSFKFEDGRNYFKYVLDMISSYPIDIFLI